MENYMKEEMLKAQTLIEALPFIQKFKRKKIVDILKEMLFSVSQKQLAQWVRVRYWYEHGEFSKLSMFFYLLKVS